MSPARVHDSVLIVEGRDDKFSVLGVVRAYIEWPEAIDDVPVYIRDAKGKENIFAEGYIATVLQQSGLRALGIMVDADDDCEACYERVRSRCAHMFPGLPRRPSADGVIVENRDGLRLGVWIMPNNVSSGDLETFLPYLVPEEMERLWARAVECTEAAKELGAPYSDVQRAKANIHTWLAWQDPPGMPFGTALTARALDPRSVAAETFVQWFRELYRL